MTEAETTTSTAAPAAAAPIAQDLSALSGALAGLRAGLDMLAETAAKGCHGDMAERLFLLLAAADDRHAEAEDALAGLQQSLGAQA